MDLVGVNSKMNEAPLPELEYEVLGIPVVPVLVYCITPGLSCHGILEFGGGDGDSVEAENNVNGSAVIAAVLELASDGEAVQGVQPLGLRVHPACRLEVGDPEGSPEALEAMTKDLEASLVLGVQSPAEIVK